MKKYIAIRGGGSNFIGELGAIAACYDKGIMQPLEFAGTSAGSILSTLLAVGYTTSELHPMLMNQDFSLFEDDENYLRLLEHNGGIYKGDYLLNWIEGMVTNKMGKPLATFADLGAKNLPTLWVVATDVANDDYVTFDRFNTPDMPVALAVRCSMSVPFVFKAAQYDGKTYVDGGLKLNYPITLFDDEAEEEVLGIFPHDVHGVAEPLDVSTNAALAKSVFENLLDSQNSYLFSNKKWLSQTILADTFGNSPMNFKNLPTERKQQLYQAGYDSAIAFINK